MKHWKKILSGAMVLAIAVVVAGVAILKSLDFNEYRGLIAEQVKAATGRDLTISGELNLELSLNPAVSVEDVTFANVSWGTRKDMVTLKRLAVEVELLPLLTGDVRVKRLVLVGLDLLVETDARGRGNWELGPTGITKRGKGEQKADASSASLPVVQRIRIQDLTVTYRDGKKGEKTTVHLDSMDMEADGPGAPMTFSLAGNINGGSFQASGRLGPLEMLFKGGAPYPVSRNLSAPGVNVTLEGSVADPGKAKGLDFRLVVDGKDIAALAKIFGASIAKVPPLKLAARISDPKGGYRLDNLSVAIGNSDLKGRVEVTLAGRARPDVKAELSSSLIDLDALLPKPAAAKPSGKGDASRVFPADPLPTDGLKAVDARVKLKIKRLIVGGVSVNDVDIGVALGAGRLDIKPLAAVVSGGKIDASLVVDGSRAPLALSVNMDARGIDYGALLKQLKITDIATGKFDAKLNVKGRGGSVRAIMAGLDGRARIVTQGGKIDSGILNVVSSDIMAALPFVDSKGDKEIRCGVIDFDIRKGRATAKTLIFETGGLGMIGTGSINLADESIDLKITPRAKKVSLLKLAMLPVNVGGTLANPSLRPDIGAAAIGAVTGAVSTAKDIASGGLSAIGSLVGIGGKKDGAGNSLDDTDYCKLALAGKPLVRAKPAPQIPPQATPKASLSTSPSTQSQESASGSTMDKADKKLDEIGKSLGGALKSLFGQ
jgi:uncharacterized protein involved in outer membrane biogenesis